MLPYYFGIEPDPKERPKDEEGAKQWDQQVAYIRAVGSCWMISGVARIFQPGSKVDTALILEGNQGILKGTALRIIGEPWFSDDLPEFGTKDCSVALSGVWIFEIGELSSMARADIDKAKRFMSCQVDRYRPPFERRTIDQPRSCIFAGTANSNDYLRDETGGRRWWPVWCASIDIEALRNDRDQLWAEAVSRFRAGEKWYLDAPELVAAARKQQDARRMPDAWEEPILKYVAGKSSVSVNEILKDALFITTDKMTQADANRVARCLKAAKWVRKQLWTADMRGKWRYFPPSSDEQPV